MECEATPVTTGCGGSKKGRPSGTPARPRGYAGAPLWSKPAIVQRTRARDSDCHAVHAPDGSDGESLRATTIDRVIAELAPARLDFLKMDLEGAEAEALAGALATLRRYRPRLAIATYHDAREESGIRALLRAHGVAYDFSYRWLVADAPFVLFGRPHNGA